MGARLPTGDARNLKTKIAIRVATGAVTGTRSSKNRRSGRPHDRHANQRCHPRFHHRAQATQRSHTPHEAGDVVHWATGRRPTPSQRQNAPPKSTITPQAQREGTHPASPHTFDWTTSPRQDGCWWRKCQTRLARYAEVPDTLKTGTSPTPPLPPSINSTAGDATAKVNPSHLLAPLTMARTNTGHKVLEPDGGQANR